MASCCSSLGCFSLPFPAKVNSRIEGRSITLGTSVSISAQSSGCKAWGSHRTPETLEIPGALASSLAFRDTRVRAAGEDTGSAASPSAPAVENMEKTPVPGGCPGCGKPEKLGGCNGEGRIQGGIGAMPGFGWLPIKAYRPCPFFVETGGRYRRTGQSLEEVAFGRKGKGDDFNVSERLKGKK